MKKTLLLAATLIASLGLAQQKTVESNVDQIMGGEEIETLAPPVKLLPGVYAMGDDEHKLHGTHYLIVDKFVNNQEKGLALLIDQEEMQDKTMARARLYMFSPIEEGSQLMLSPIVIDPSTGQLVIHSKIDRTGKSPILTISVDPEAQKLNYPYIIRGHNGALGGQLLGMRAKSDQNPTFRPWPKHSVFNSETSRGKLLIQGKTVSIHEPSRREEEFKLVPINGVLGKMAALVSTELDTMGEGYTSDTAIEKMAFFMNLDGEELFMIATPGPRTSLPGEFFVNFYGERHRTFLDYFRKGKLQPTSGRSWFSLDKTKNAGSRSNQSFSHSER
jgi:hypothetical protein